ncbi:hypothetical protein SNEBB_002484, partial [Seison nebaliae]
RYLKKNGPGVLLDYELYQTTNGCSPGPFHTILMYRVEDFLFVYDPFITSAQSVGDFSNGLLRKACQYIRRNVSSQVRLYQVIQETISNPNCFISCIDHMDTVDRHRVNPLVVTKSPFTYHYLELSKY